MSAFHLRPVSEISPSPSPTASTTTPGDRSPPYKAPVPSRPSPSPATSTAINGRVRRPLSPSSLRDVDLTHSTDVHPRKYPAPPTGHDLMAMFPPAPPDNFPEMRPGPTSGYFQRQERAFFAQAGKEIVRVRVEVDLPHSGDSELGKPSSASLSRANSGSRPWPPPPVSSASSAHGGPVGSASSSSSPSISSSAAPVLYPHPAPRTSPRGPVSVNPATLFPLTTNHSHPHSHPPPPPNLHVHQNGSGIRTPPQDSSQQGPPSAKTEFQPEDYDDEAWRRPMPYAERRRAGKHTRRVIVRT